MKMTNPPLNEKRDELDQIDQHIVEALAKRQQCIEEIALIKLTQPEGIQDLKRENDIIERLHHLANKVGADQYLVTKLYRMIMSHSRRVQETHFTQKYASIDNQEFRVGYQGSEGAYSSLAAREYFSVQKTKLMLHGYASFSEMMEAVRDGIVKYGVLPVENTTAGSINEAYDLLARMDLKIIGEHVHHIEHCLIALESVPISRIRRVLSHPQALQQCSRFLASLENCEVTSYTDTAMAVEKLVRDEDLLQAAIASEEAANLHDLAILKRDIANQKDNYTRFVIVAREAESYDSRIACKTSLVFATRDEQGALLAALNILAAQGLNLTKLESRPRPNVPWEYLFYVDFEGNVQEERVRNALRLLSSKTAFLKVLGSYPIRHAKTLTPAQVNTVVEKEQPILQPVQTILKSLEKKPYKLASRATRLEDTEIHVGEVIIGGKRPIVIAGPCSVESREQVMSIAKTAKKAGAEILCGGCFKPRTSPYDFQGLGYEGLDLLYEAGQTYGMPIVTEVMHPADVKPVAEKSDILQIGARNMQNFSLLKEIGAVDRPIILKRGLMSTIDEWLNAAEYILSRGNQRVILCERGIRTFETATRSTLDLSAVPVVRERSHLPIIVDPSHASGTWQYIPALAEAAMAIRAHGIMVEIHPEPTRALSDGPQALKFDTFDKLMHRLSRYR